jgi:hypothetical protein
VVVDVPVMVVDVLVVVVVDVLLVVFVDVLLVVVIADSSLLAALPQVAVMLLETQLLSQ